MHRGSGQCTLRSSVATKSPQAMVVIFSGTKQRNDCDSSQGNLTNCGFYLSQHLNFVDIQ